MPTTEVAADSKTHTDNGADIQGTTEEKELSILAEEATYLGSIVETREPQDEDYDTDLEDEKYPKVRPIPTRDRPRVVYLKACRRYNIIPSSSFLRGIKTNVVNLNHLGIGSKGTMAVALGLVMCNTIHELHMADNSVGDIGIKYITQMLKDDDTISVVDLSDNNLQSYGAQLVTNMTLDNDNIISLKLSGNRFKACDAEQIHLMISHYRCVLRELDLSHNEFGEIGGKLLGEAIGNNDTIEDLNISWNRLGPEGAKAVAKGLQENTSLKHLDISWNGIGDKGSSDIAEAMVTTDTLTSLHMVSNRISQLGLGPVMKAVCECKSLRTFDVSRNPITFEGPVIALTVVNEHPECGLQELSFEDMCVSEHFEPLFNTIRKEKPKFKVKHGGFVNGSDTIAHAWRQRDENILNDSMMKLLQYVHEKRLRWSDLFFQLDVDKSMAISEKEFIEGLKRAGIQLTDEQTRDLMARLDTDKDGEVDFGELIEGQRRYLNRLGSLQDMGDIDPALLTRPERSNINNKQKSRPNSSNQASRPSSSAQRSRPHSSAQKSRPSSSTQKSRPPSSQRSRPSSNTQRSRPPSSKARSRPSSSNILPNGRPVSRDESRKDPVSIAETHERELTNASTNT